MHDLVLNAAMHLPDCVVGDGWFNLGTLISQCATAEQPHPSQSLGQVRLLKPALIHTHSTVAMG